MSAADPHLDEQHFEQLLGNVLRAGVLLAGTVVLLGAILFLVRHGAESPDHKIFHGEPADLRNPVGIFEKAVEPSGAGVIQLGLLLLIATPVARVVFSVFGFLRERDYLYVALTLFVLGILLYSLFFGEAG